MKCVLSIALVVRTKPGYTIVYAFLENCKDYPGVAVNFDRSDTLSRRRNFVTERNFCPGNIMPPGNLIAYVACH